MHTISGIDVPMTIEELLVPRQSAVLVLAMQNELVSEQGELARHGGDVALVQAVVPRIQQLLAAARAAGVLVAYAEQIQRNRLGLTLATGPDYFAFRDAEWAPWIQEGTWAARTVTELAPRAGDALVAATRASAFAGTPLDAILRARGIRSLVLVGTGLAGAIVHSFYDTQQRGYYPLIVADAIAPTEPDSLLLPELTGMAPQFMTREIVHLWRGADASCTNHI